VLIVGAAEGTRDKSVLERQAQPLWESSDRGHGVRRSWPDPREAGKPNFVPLGCARSIDRIGLAVPGAALIKGDTTFPFTPAMPLNQAVIDENLFALKDENSSDSREIETRLFLATTS
jgi:hypothetical protein